MSRRCKGAVKLDRMNRICRMDAIKGGCEASLFLLQKKIRVV